MGAVGSQVVLASVQNTIGYVIAGILILGFLGAVALNMRKGSAEVGSELTLAPNRGGLPSDDELETTKLDRTLTYGLVLLGIIALALPLYWLAEPGRQEGEIERFDRAFVSRGEQLYTTGAQCSSCHGPNGVGGAKDYTILNGNGDFVSSVSWKAPALNTVLYRYSRDEVRFIITYGRGFSPMAAWGADGGGPLTDQQIDNLLDYLYSIQLPASTAAAELDKQIADQCAPGDTEPSGDAPCTNPDAPYKTLGETLFNMGYTDGFAGGAYSCGRCHTKGWSYGDAQVPGGGSMGPNLTGGSVLRQFDTASDQIQFVMEGAATGKTYGNAGLSGAGMMPGFGINPNKDPVDAPGPRILPMNPDQFMYTEDQIAAIVAYERSL